MLHNVGSASGKLLSVFQRSDCVGLWDKGDARVL